MIEELENIKNRFAEGCAKSIDVGIGWHPIIISLDKALFSIDPEYKIYQIKQKFGGLRYYCEAKNYGIVKKLISEAETESFNTCENCGKFGELRNNKNYVATLCQECSLQNLKLVN